jgi:hypothetical protein
MPLEIDHVFVCAAAGAPEADLLLTAGLAEGLPNTHPGQGTACRRFPFRNAYLELVWVHDEAEARGDATAPTRLWERWHGRSDGRTSPFGVCVRATGGDPILFPTWSYRPAYLPPGTDIPVATNGDALHEPMLFVMPPSLRPGGRSPGGAPPVHPSGVRELTRVEVAGALEDPGEALGVLAGSGLIELRAGRPPLLVLGFDGESAGRSVDLRPALPLVLRW